MLFPECELLASEEPDFYGAMVKLDSLFEKICEKGVLDVDDISVEKSIDKDLLELIFPNLVDKGFLQVEKYVICPACGSLNDYEEYEQNVVDGDIFECTYCGFELKMGMSPVVRYRIVAAKLPDFIVNNRHLNIKKIQELPAELVIENIDNFGRVKEVNPEAVSDLLDKNGYFKISEDKVQHMFEEILSEKFHKKDWGGGNE